MKLYYSPFHDPYRNLAMEQTLFQRGEEAVYLWVNAPCVVIGRNQNPYRETDLTCLSEYRIALMRRFSGGGAVYHDLGNLNFTYICQNPEPEGILTLVRSVLHSVGVQAVPGGRNDLLVGDRKVGGMASQLERICLHHGTLMVDVDLDVMTRALRPSPLKLQAKGIPSVRARVANLTGFVQGLTVSRLLAAFRETLGMEETPMEVTPGVLRLEGELRSPEWIYGESPDYDLTLERQLNGSIYQLDLQIIRGRIHDVAIYTDALEPLDLPALRSMLLGIPFDVHDIDRMLKQFNQTSTVKVAGNGNSKPGRKK